MKHSIIIDEHHALMGAVLQGVRSIHARLNDAVQGLLTGFEVIQVIFFPCKMVLTCLTKVSTGRTYNSPRDYVMIAKNLAEGQIFVGQLLKCRD